MIVAMSWQSGPPDSPAPPRPTPTAQRLGDALRGFGFKRRRGSSKAARREASWLTGRTFRSAAAVTDSRRYRPFARSYCSSGGGGGGGWGGGGGCRPELATGVGPVRGRRRARGQGPCRGRRAVAIHGRIRPGRDHLRHVRRLPGEDAGGSAGLRRRIYTTTSKMWTR